MFIETEATPNPDTLKFLPGRMLMDEGTANFTDVEAAKGSPLATALFGLADVRGVFVGYDFVTVTKATESDWSVVKPAVLGTLMTFFASGAPVIDPAYLASMGGQGDAEEDAEIIAQIRQLLDEKIRPAVAQDGGDIVYHGFKEGVVYLQMQGACSGCPSSTITLKNGIENLLKYYVPEVIDVRAVDL